MILMVGGGLKSALREKKAGQEGRRGLVLHPGLLCHDSFVTLSDTHPATQLERGNLIGISSPIHEPAHPSFSASSSGSWSYWGMLS